MHARTQRTAVVLQRYLPGKKVGRRLMEDLLADAEALTLLDEARNSSATALRAARRAAAAAFQRLRLVSLKAAALIKTKTGHLPLMDGALGPVFAIVPRTPLLAEGRARALLPLWRRADALLAAQPVPEPPLRWDGTDAEGFEAMLKALLTVQQTVAETKSRLRQDSDALHKATRALDHWNKCFYKLLKAEHSPELIPASALAQILTGP